MTEQKLSTLAELWRAGGGKPIKVRRDCWGERDWIRLIAKAPASGFYAHTDDGTATSAFDECDAKEWCLYVEPAPEPRLVPHWPAITEQIGYPFQISANLYPESYKGSRSGGCFVRLATEYPPVMLPERES